MQKQANAPSVAPKSVDAFHASAVAQLGGGKTYDAAPVTFEGDLTLIAEVNSAETAFPLLIVMAPSRAPGQISLVNRTPWPVLFTISGILGQPSAHGAIEVAPGELRHARPG